MDKIKCIVFALLAYFFMSMMEGEVNTFKFFIEFCLASFCAFNCAYIMKKAGAFYEDKWAKGKDEEML